VCLLTSQEAERVRPPFSHLYPLTWQFIFSHPRLLPDVNFDLVSVAMTAWDMRQKWLRRFSGGESPE
jgi:hypothetical protein